MSGLYWVNEWAKIRQDEVIRLPGEFFVHGDFLKNIDRADFVSAFRQVWEIFVSAYGEMAKSPEAFGLPLVKPEEHDYFSLEARESRNAPHRFFTLLYNIFICGEINGGELAVDADRFKKINKVKNSRALLEKLCDYGFELMGLKSLAVTGDFRLAYPDNANVPAVLKLMADKAESARRLKDFLVCHYKLFKDGLGAADYGNGADIVADSMHTEREREFVYEFDRALKDLGFFARERSWNEGPGYAYYASEKVMQSKGAYHFWLLSWKSALLLYLRVRNVGKCAEYLKECPDSVKEIFLRSDEGCANRYNGKCKSGVEYEIDGKPYRRCACCNAAFYFRPKTEDIPHYIKLVELGIKK